MLRRTLWRLLEDVVCISRLDVFRIGEEGQWGWRGGLICCSEDDNTAVSKVLADFIDNELVNNVVLGALHDGDK